MNDPEAPMAVRPSIARGLAMIALLCTLVVVGRSLLPESRPSADNEPSCTAPVEVSQSWGTRLGCADEADLAACAQLEPGDRVSVGADGCRVERASMSASMRLLLGLPLDINRVTRQDLTLINGIGPKLASAIVATRRERGRFKRLDDLQDVLGIGPATLAHLRPLLSIAVDQEAATAPIDR